MNCAYCGKEHRHDFICGEMFVTHAQVVLQGEAMTNKDRITAYLASGGLFNPECIDHNEVRNLLLDCREELDSLRAQLDAERDKSLLRQANCIANGDSPCDGLLAEREAHKRTSRQANEAIETANASCAAERKAREEAELQRDNYLRIGDSQRERAETAEAELARINPLYTAACIRVRDAEAALEREKAAMVEAEEHLEQATRDYLKLVDRLHVQRDRAEAAVASWDEERQRAEREGKRVADLTERLAQIDPLLESHGVRGCCAICESFLEELRELCNAEGTPEAPESRPVVAAVFGPEKQDYPGGPIYRVGTSKGIVTGSEYAAGLAQWAERQGEKK